MKYRDFSNTGWKTSEIGLGCWAIGSEWGDVSPLDAREVLKTSLDNGVNFFLIPQMFMEMEEAKSLLVSLYIPHLKKYLLRQNLEGA